jgi:hypothetical protein
MFGATERLLISPRHKVLVDGNMIEARFLGLEQEEQKGIFKYYNLQITRYHHMIVAGVEVESLRMNIRGDRLAFKKLVEKRGIRVNY